MQELQAVEINNNELDVLTGLERGTKVSLIMPVEQEPDKRDANRIRLKNMIGMAEEELAARDIPNTEIQQLLAPAENMVAGGRFMHIQSPGLALYLGQDFARAYYLPYSPQETVTVAEQYQVTPLIPLFQPADFFVLALSQQNVRLLRATEFSVQRVDLHDMPQSLDEALRWDDPEKQLQWHTQTMREVDGQSAGFHGHGVTTKERQKENLLRYFQILDQGISERMAQESSPLILAGVDYLLPIYRQASDYAYISDEEINGNVDHLSDADIQRLAWEIMARQTEGQQESINTRYKELAARDRASNDLDEILPAAYQGRVDALIITADEHRWGSFNPDSGQFSRSTEAEPAQSELVNLAAIYTLQNGGDVHMANARDLAMPDAMAAIFRF